MSAAVNRGATANPNESDEVSYLGNVLNRKGPICKVAVLYHVLRVDALLLVSVCGKLDHCRGSGMYSFFGGDGSTRFRANNSSVKLNCKVRCGYF